MRWRDIRFEKPTEADLDHKKRVCMLFDDNSFGLHTLPLRDFVVAWCPTSELPAFDRIPDPPEGWRFVDKEKEAFDNRAKIWNRSHKKWILSVFNYYHDDYVYIVPIGPPAPTYRPFANAAEFEPYRDKWWRYKSQGSDEYNPPVAFNDKLHANQCWQDSFENKVFADDTPFGVHVHT